MENSNKKIIKLAAAVLLIGLNALTCAEAAGVFINCSYEERVGSSSGAVLLVRSKAKVIVKGLPKGRYYAQYRSIDKKWIDSRRKSTNGSQKIEFEFDSDPEDVAFEGKTQIPAEFNASGSATAIIRKVRSLRQAAFTRSSVGCRSERITVDDNAPDDDSPDDNGGDDNGDDRQGRNRGRQ